MENIIGGSHSIVLPAHIHKHYTGEYNPDKICKVSTDINYELVLSRFLETKDKKKCRKYYSYLEADSICKLTNNRSLANFIISLSDFSKINKPIVDFYYFTMDFAGKDLFEFCQDKDAIMFNSESGFKDMVYQLFKGINYLHSLGVCHFDIKPENITYSITSKYYKYIDFGYSEQYPFIGYINNGPRGTLDYIPIKYNEHDKTKIKLDISTPYVECNDWTPKYESVYKSTYKFFNRLYPELAYKADTYALGKTLYYMYYFMLLESKDLNKEFKMGIEALIFTLINNDVHDRPYLCNVKFKKYFKIRNSSVSITPLFGSPEYLYQEKSHIDYATRLLDCSVSSSTSTVNDTTSLISNDSINTIMNNKDDYSDTESITSLEVQNNSHNCLSKLRINFGFKKLISFLFYS